ncbi:hypothetical protein V8E55_008212, partial [Tylopilus felleus]
KQKESKQPAPNGAERLKSVVRRLPPNLPEDCHLQVVSSWEATYETLNKEGIPRGRISRSRTRRSWSRLVARMMCMCLGTRQAVHQPCRTELRKCAARDVPEGHCMNIELHFASSNHDAILRGWRHGNNAMKV